MPAIPTHDTAVVDQPWDAGSEVDKIKTPVTKPVGEGEWAWYDPSSPDTDDDGGYPDAKSGYKFPHHIVSADGTPGAAVVSACNNALARVDDADIADPDKAGVRTHVQHHLDAYKRKQSAARAEAYAVEALEMASEAAVAASDAQSAALEAQGVDSALTSYSDVDYMRAENADVGQIVEKPWAITRGGAIAVVTRLALHAQGQFRSDEQIARLQAAARQPAPRKAASDGSEIAVIPLRGTITPRGSLFSLIFGGGGGLEMFREQFRMAMADGNVSAIVLDIDSPGGLIDMVPETAATILGARGQKPITAVANTTCASAAYWIASAADTVIATPSAQVGSIGVFTIHEDYSRMENAMGITTTLVSAGQFKTEGNPYEPLSKQARTALQAEVDDLYGMFTGQVAEGRGVSKAAVQAGYGRGRCLLADQAFQIGMVDRVDTLEATIARLGGTVAVPVDPAVQPGDLEDCADGPEASFADQATPTMTIVDKTSPDKGADKLDVSTPPADYLGQQPTRSWL